jgi:hypothetical protein
MENHFETFKWQREKAEKALQAAKALEAEKMKNGARYQRTDSKTWVLAKI